MDFRVTGLFSNADFRDAFKDLFTIKRQEDVGVVPEYGPLAYILANYPVKAAKGGSKYPEWSDQTYFTHVLNGCIIGGRALEATTRATDQEQGRYLIRLFFAGVTMHDANKLFAPGKEAALNLASTVSEHLPEIASIVGSYLSKMDDPSEKRSPDVWVNDLKYLILSAEEGTRDQANLLKTSVARPVLQSLGEYIKLSDQVGGIKASDSLLIYRELARLLEKNGTTVHILRFTDIPQTVLRLRIGKAVTKVLNREGRLICKLPDAVIYSGETIENRVLEETAEYLSKEQDPLDDENLEHALRRSPPTHNKLSFGFARQMPVSSKVLDRYIDIHNVRIILWSGEEWRRAHADLPEVMRKDGVLMKSIEGGSPRFVLDWPEDTEDASDSDLRERRNIAKLVCVKRIHLALTSGAASEVETKYLAERGLLNPSVDKIQMDTLLSFAFAALHKAELPQIYESILKETANELEKQNAQKISTDMLQFVRSVLVPNALADVDAELPSKGEMCIQCGRKGAEPLEASLAFGIKATCGGGRKISCLKYGDRVNGRLCALCRMENEARKDLFGNIGDGIAIQVSLGDYLSPINLKYVLKVLKEKDPSIDTENGIIRLSQAESFQLDYHTLLFIEKPSNKKDEFRRFRDSIAFVMRTGFKVRITPLFSAEHIFKPMFAWENAPSWVKALGWDEIRIDELEDVRKECDLINRVAQLGRSKQALTHVLVSRARHPRSIYNIIYRFLVNKGSLRNLSGPELKELIQWYTEKYSIEVNKLAMDRVVEAACDIVYSNPESNNDHRWMMQTALDVFERSKHLPKDDRVQRAAGRLWESAKRRNDRSGKKVQMACMAFAQELANLLDEEYPKGLPSTEVKRDLIAQFAIMYNLRKWSSVKEKVVS
jgi:hypothetical protein